jgi:hypothetical protein
MTHAIVSIEIPPKQRLDLALPLNVPNQLLAASLVQALNLPESEKGSYLLSIKSESGVARLPASATLGEAGVLDGFILQLQPWDMKNSSRSPMESRFFLQAETGEVFPLNADKMLVGRRDIKHGVMVDIDLGPYDSNKVISRRHASIEKKGKGFIIIDMASTNGTKLNGKRLVPKEQSPVADGDVIEFGRDGVRLRFVEKS